MSSEITQDEFIDIGTRMAQELQDCIADAEQARCVNPFPGMQQLIDEWEEIYSRANTWQKDIADDNDIAALNI